MKRFLVVACVLTVLPCMMGATCVLTAVTPNPNGMPQKLKLDGTWSVGQGETAVNVVGNAKLKPSNPAQVTVVGATTNGNNWSAQFTLAPATYTCWGTLAYMKMGFPGQVFFQDSGTMDAVVQ